MICNCCGCKVFKLLYQETDIAICTNCANIKYLDEPTEEQFEYNRNKYPQVAKRGSSPTCKQGHVKTPENTRKTGDCKICYDAYQTARRATQEHKAYMKRYKGKDTTDITFTEGGV